MTTRFPNGITANVIGNVTGNTTGNTTGNVTGRVQQPVGTVVDAGTIGIESGFIALVKSAAGTWVLPTPTATTHDGIEITIMATTAAAHVVTTGTVGFNDGGTAKDTATFGGAKGDNFTVFAYNGRWWVPNLLNVTLG